MFDFHSTNTNSLDYYLYYLISLFSFYGIVLMINNSIRKSFPNTTLNISLDVFGKEQHIQIIHDAPTLEQKNLRWNFLAVSSMIKAATWIKAPYIFALYNRVHKFSRAEIGVLYAVDNLSALMFGPILGTLSDLYGRRKFCLLYCVVVVSHIYLRITGQKVLAYPAQILNGISGSILETVFESWLNFEANLLFEKSQEGEMKKNHYLKEIFNK
jgi:MFS family permease